MKSIHDLIRAAVTDHLTRRAEHIEAHLRTALIMGCGVRVRTYRDGSYTVAIDPTIPARTIHEEHPDQPTYGMSFED